MNTLNNILLIKESLNIRKEQLLRWKKEIEKSLSASYPGTLRICKHKNRTQYYHRTDSNDYNGVYIPKKNHLLIQNLAQKDYNKKILSAINKEISLIQKFLTSYPQYNAEQLYTSLHPERQKLVIPLYETDEHFISSWESLSYSGKAFHENLPELYTSKGERVRSKSEIIIADLLNKEGIPYRYEYPLYLYGIGKIYPDFTTLNIKNRKEILWEHFGMMDDSIYAENAIQKIAAYEKNGFFPGDNLILTYESKKNPINQKLLLRIIEKYFS